MPDVEIKFGIFVPQSHLPTISTERCHAVAAEFFQKNIHAVHVQYKCHASFVNSITLFHSAVEDRRAEKTLCTRHSERLWAPRTHQSLKRERLTRQTGRVTDRGKTQIPNGFNPVRIVFSVPGIGQPSFPILNTEHTSEVDPE